MFLEIPVLLVAPEVFLTLCWRVSRAYEMFDLREA